MMMRRLFVGLACAGTLAAQTFIQMSDPQFGMFTKNASFEHETVNLEFAIASANRLKPAFVVITGDLINDPASAAQAAEHKRITAKLDSKIRLFSVPGNHDVGNEPTKETLARHRERVGAGSYSFRIGDSAGIVLYSNLQKGTKNVPEEATKMEAWFRPKLEKAKGAKHILVFPAHSAVQEGSGRGRGVRQSAGGRAAAISEADEGRWRERGVRAAPALQPGGARRGPRIAVIEAGEYRGRFQRLGRRQCQILQFTAVEGGVLAIINGDVRLPSARQPDHLLAAFGRRLFAVAPADSLSGIVQVASPRDMDAGACISHRRRQYSRNS